MTEAGIHARVRELAGDDVAELAAEVIMILGQARAARLDPDALGGLVGAAFALGGDQLTIYTAGPPLHTPHRDDASFLEAVAEAADGIAEALAQAKELQREAATALASALAALDEARAMPTGTDAQDTNRAAALMEAAQRVAAARDADYAARTLARHLERAQLRLVAVPEDLGDTYQAAYDLIRGGGRLPADGDWLTGEGASGWGGGWSTTGAGGGGTGGCLTGACKHPGCSETVSGSDAREANEAAMQHAGDAHGNPHLGFRWSST
jgi:hypothetical protein